MLTWNETDEGHELTGIVEAPHVAGHDNTVRYGKRVLQIPQARHRHHFVKAKVKVHEYADGSLALFHGPRRIADYDAAGTLLQAPEAKEKSAA